MKNNPLLMTDGYKSSHLKMYPKDTTLVYSNYTCRNTNRMPKEAQDIVVFGIQYMIKYIQELFQNDFFSQDKSKVCGEAKEYLSSYLGTDYDVSHFKALHDLGYLPIEIKALEEGTIINAGIPLFTIKNTLPKFFWVTNYLETLLSTLIWKPVHSASLALAYKKVLTKYCLETDKDNLGFVDFQGHDFSFRGMQSPESAISSAMGFLTSFKGTDTIPALVALKHYYNSSNVGFSVPASEHSVMCAHGKEGEIHTLEYLMEQYPTGILSVVSDTWDLWKLLTEYLPQLKEDILKRNGKLVIRPDCYSEDTLFLTNYGWKSIDDIKQGALVAQVEEDGSYTFVQPRKIVDEPYEGEMYKYTDFHGKMDLLVTPNHRMVYKQFDNWKVDYAENCKPNNYTKQFIRSSKAFNKGRKLSFIERLNIAFQADGTYQTGVTSSIRFSFSKIRKIQRLENLLKENNIEYTTYNLGDGKTEFNIKIDKSQVSKDFNWVNINDLCSNWCQEFIEELSHWDSCVRNEGRVKFDTTNKAVISTVELIALSAGYGCLISEYEDERSELFSKVYTANILMDNKLGGQSIQIEKTNYKGNIVCVTVPTGRILVKRNRCTMVCGNSGDPVDIICGINTSPRLSDKVKQFSDLHHDVYGKDIRKFGDSIINESEFKGVIELLWDIFGGTINEQGFKVLDPHIGAIYGDSITLERAKQICERLKAKGFATTNIVLGIGSYSMGYATRDNQGGAVKSTYVEVTHKENIGNPSTPAYIEPREIFKDPITDDGTKRSKKGLLHVGQSKVGDIICIDQCDYVLEKQGLLTTVFKDGKLTRETSLDEIRTRLLY